MTSEEIQREALRLEPAARAELARTLLLSLEDLSGREADLLWAEEAARRDARADEDPSGLRRAEDVFREARSRLR